MNWCTEPLENDKKVEIMLGKINSITIAILMSVGSLWSMISVPNTSVIYFPFIMFISISISSLSWRNCAIGGVLDPHCCLILNIRNIDPLTLAVDKKVYFHTFSINEIMAHSLFVGLDKLFHPFGIRIWIVYNLVSFKLLLLESLAWLLNAF